MQNNIANLRILEQATPVVLTAFVSFRRTQISANVLAVSSFEPVPLCRFLRPPSVHWTHAFDLPALPLRGSITEWYQVRGRKTNSAGKTETCSGRQRLSPGR